MPSLVQAESMGEMDLGGIGGGSADGARLTVDDFELIKVLGKGSFGKVMLCRKKDEGKNGPLYAMKVCAGDSGCEAPGWTAGKD